MNYFTEEFMNKQRRRFVSSLKKAQVNIGTHAEPNWIDGEILKAEVNEDGLAIFQAAFIDLIPMKAEVCQIRIFDEDDEVASLVDKKVLTALGQGVYETLKIDIFQTDVEVV